MHFGHLDVLHVGIHPDLLRRRDVCESTSAQDGNAQMTPQQSPEKPLTPEMLILDVWSLVGGMIARTIVQTGSWLAINVYR
jgi:hypothetical protein